MGNALARPADIAVGKKQSLDRALVKRENIIQGLLPPGFPFAKLRALAFASFSKTPFLLKCTEESILGSLIEAAKLGLEPDTGAQLCHLIPYKGKCTLQMGFRGLMHLAQRAHGKLLEFGSAVVYANDEFEHVDFPPKLHHKALRTGDRGAYVAAYAFAGFPDGRRVFRVCYADEILKIKSSAVSRANGRPIPWTNPDHEPAMWEKTVLKRLCKFLPLPESTYAEAVGRAVMLDDAADDGRPQKMEQSWENLEDDAAAITVEQVPPEPSGDEKCPACKRGVTDHAEGCPEDVPL